MKEKIFEYLRTNFADLGLGKEILGGYADFLAATVTEEDGIAAAVETIKPLLVLQQKENDKMRNKYAADRDKAEKEKKAKDDSGRDDKKDVEIEDDGEQVEKPKRTPQKEKQKGDDEMPDYIKKLFEEVKDLKTSLKNKDRAMELGNRRKEINGIIGKLPKVFQASYGRMDLDIADDDYEALKQSVEKEVNDTISELQKKRATFSPPYAGQGSGEAKEISKEEADKIAKSLLNH